MFQIKTSNKWYIVAIKQRRYSKLVRLAQRLHSQQPPQSEVSVFGDLAVAIACLFWGTVVIIRVEWKNLFFEIQFSWPLETCKMMLSSVSKFKTIEAWQTLPELIWKFGLQNCKN